MGGMGAVYEVVHLETERRRALKVMLPNIVESTELRDRFRQEARIAAHIESEHIVDVFDAGFDTDTKMPFLVMELLRGEELGQRLKRLGRFAPSDTVMYLEQTARALDKTHRASIVHRDLKPENLFLTEREDGRPHIKILDYGIAKFLADGATAANATRSIGTPFYMAPEQFKTGSAVSASADIYALGMVAYTFLVGVPYWKEDAHVHNNVFAFAMHAIKGPEELASARAKRFDCTLSAAFDEWFSKATALDPTKRFASAGEAVAALGIVLNVLPRQGDGIATVLGLGEPPVGKTAPLSAALSRSSSPQMTPVPSVANLSPVMTIPLMATKATGESTTPISSPNGPSLQSFTTDPQNEATTSNPGARRKRRTMLTIGVATFVALLGIGGVAIAFRLSNMQTTPKPGPTAPTSTNAPMVPPTSSDAQAVPLPDSARSNAGVTEPVPMQPNPPTTPTNKVTSTPTRPNTKTTPTKIKDLRF